MRDMARENGEQFALLPYKEEIGTLAQSLKGVWAQTSSWWTSTSTGS